MVSMRKNVFLTDKWKSESDSEMGQCQPVEHLSTDILVTWMQRNSKIFVAGLRGKVVEASISVRFILMLERVTVG